MDIAIHVILGVVTVLLLLQFITSFMAMRLAAIKSPKWPRFKYAVFGFNIVLLFLAFVHLNVLSAAMARKARNEIKATLGRLDVEKATVKIDGRVITEKADFCRALEGLRMMISSRSVSQNTRDCQIVYQGREVLLLVIRQNSTRLDQYWVYYPRYRYTRLNRIGGFYLDAHDLKDL